ncbi:MAG: hypothetical protein F6K56_16425 [Moorea sp. SIO3G5]|nr:hypothetical protein [Moorena sp. SIO3G5]
MYLPYYLFPVPCSLFPTPYSLLPTPCSLFPTPYSLLPTPYSLLPTPLNPLPMTKRTVKLPNVSNWDIQIIPQLYGYLNLERASTIVISKPKSRHYRGCFIDELVSGIVLTNVKKTVGR